MKAYTDLEQSRKLAEFLPLESADMYYTPSLIKGHTNYFPHLKRRLPIDWDIEQAIPCWSLAALLSVLPEGTKLLKSTTDNTYHCDCPKGNIDKWFDNPIDASFEMIIKLKEKELL